MKKYFYDFENSIAEIKVDDDKVSLETLIGENETEAYYEDILNEILKQDGTDSLTDFLKEVQENLILTLDNDCDDDLVKSYIRESIEEQRKEALSIDKAS